MCWEAELASLGLWPTELGCRSLEEPVQESMEFLVESGPAVKAPKCLKKPKGWVGCATRFKFKHGSGGCPLLLLVEPSLSMDFINMARGAAPSQMVAGFIPMSPPGFLTTLSKSVATMNLATHMPHR
jgi:hypothetical protein